MTTEFTGWVLRSSAIGFTVGCRQLPHNVPQFGNLVKVLAQNETYIFGLIYDVEVRDDPAVRQLILAGEMEPEVMQDQRENRLVPIEISVLVVGYEQQGRLIQGLPPQPPISLDALMLCDEEDIRAFTAEGNFAYLRLILNAAHIPTEELIIANLRQAAAVHAPEIRRQFLLRAGRELARLLSGNLTQLDGILRRIKP